MRAVVITGAGSGIGEACARRLGALGFHIFAGLHSGGDAEVGEAAPAGPVQPFTLDVTDAAAIAAAVDLVRSAVGDEGLAGLVNNAGIAVAGPLEFLPVEALERQMAVNVVGPMAVTRAFLPLIRQGKGRIVNIGSVSGRVALPFLGPYAASKFALRALTDSLRVELRPSGVPVSLVEPASVATGIWEKGVAGAEEWRKGYPPEAEARYGRGMDAAVAQARRTAEHGIAPERVAAAVVAALTDARPRAHYLVAPPSRRVVTRLLGVLPTELRDAFLAGRLG